MRIERVVFDNYCQHAHRDDLFGSGTIGILGANGSGKSNYLKGILRGLTGVSVNDGNNADDVAWGAEKGSVIVEFSSHGQYGQIKRDLGSARCQMRFGDKVFKTAKEVDLAIYDILGVSARVLHEMVFVQQGNMFSVLTGKPSERAKAFQTLFGTADAESIRELLQTDLAATAIGNYTEQIDQLSGLKSEAETKLTAADLELSKWSLNILPEALYKAYEAQVKQVDLNKHYRQQLEETQRSLDRLAGQRKQQTDTINANMSYCILNKEILDSLKADVVAAQEQISSHQTLLAKWRQRDEATKRLQTFQQQLGELVAPPDTAPYTDIQIKQTNDQLTQYTGELQTSQRVISLKNTDDPHCPTCFQPLNADHLAHHQDRFDKLSPEVQRWSAGLGQMRQAQQNFLMAQQSYVTRKKFLDTEVANSQLALDRLPEVQLPDQEVLLAAQELVTTYREIEVEYTRRSTETGVLQQNLTNLDSTMNSLRQQHQDLNNQIVEVTPEAFAKAAEAIKIHTQATAQINSLTGTRNTLVDQIQRTTNSIDVLRKEDALTTRKREWRDLVEQARIVLHRDQLPNLVAQAYLKDLNQRLMQYLETFNVPFMAYIKADLSVECTFGGGRSVPVGRLSGGQLVMLGIAFHFAKHELFAGDVGVLVLDEPTVYLDQQRIPAVYSTLERVKSYSKNAGLQLIVVTHEPKLMSVFDRTIQL